MRLSALLRPCRAWDLPNAVNPRDILVGNGLRAVPQYHAAGFLAGLANTEIVNFGPHGIKIHGTAHRPSPTNPPYIFDIGTFHSCACHFKSISIYDLDIRKGGAAVAYSELIKNFDRIRDFMRQFYIYGFRSRRPLV